MLRHCPGHSPKQALALASRPFSRLIRGGAWVQRNALGEAVKVTAAWDGAVHKATMVGSARGRHTTWRYMDAGLMVVRTAVQLDKGRETSMFWYLEAIEDPEHLPDALHGQAPPSGCLHTG